ncbi:MAG: TatD family hydrolase, partial [Candidatus Hydrothermarchaeales archaeon]
MKLDTITDNHMHIDPINGDGIEAVKRFKRAGGTCLFLVNKMSKDLGVNIRGARDFEEVFDRTIALKEKIIKETDLKVFAVIGVHPAEFVFLCDKLGIDRALEITKEAVELAGMKVSEGMATAIGEMGRPHFSVDDKLLEASNELLIHAMEAAKDASCPIQVHAESASRALFEDLSSKAKSIRLKTEKVVKHFCGAHVALAEEYGIMPSVLASKENIMASLKNPRFFMESDYIDDRRRPGAVLGPKTVPKTTLKLIEEGFLSVEDATRIHKD